ncbi:hypothetical protein ACRAWD_05925 [Caulobacter segnis]
MTISKDGFQPSNNAGLAVRPGGESNYSFTLAATGEVSEVVITATARPELDFSQTTTGLAVDVEQLVKSVPVVRSVQGLALLAPGAIAGGAGNYASQTAIGGALGVGKRLLHQRPEHHQLQHVPRRRDRAVRLLQDV